MHALKADFGRWKSRCFNVTVDWCRRGTFWYWVLCLVEVLCFSEFSFFLCQNPSRCFSLIGWSSHQNCCYFHYLPHSLCCCLTLYYIHTYTHTHTQPLNSINNLNLLWSTCLSYTRAHTHTHNLYCCYCCLHCCHQILPPRPLLPLLSLSKTCHLMRQVWLCWQMESIHSSYTNKKFFCFTVVEHNIATKYLYMHHYQKKI